METKLKKENLTTNEEDRNHLEAGADVEEVNESKSYLKSYGESCGEKIHCFSSKVCDVHCCQQSGH